MGHDDAVDLAGCQQTPDVSCQPRDNPRCHVKARDQRELGEPRLGVFAQSRDLGQQLVGMHHRKGGAGGGIDPAGDRSAGGDDVNDRLPQPRLVEFSFLGHVRISSDTDRNLGQSRKKNKRGSAAAVRMISRNDHAKWIAAQSSIPWSQPRGPMIDSPSGQPSKVPSGRLICGKPNSGR
jgi:hypothetical protein